MISYLFAPLILAVFTRSSFADLKQRASEADVVIVVNGGWGNAPMELGVILTVVVGGWQLFTTQIATVAEMLGFHHFRARVFAREIESLARATP